MAANDKKTTKQTLERVKAWANQEFVRNTVNNLVNYYLKSETYTKAEVQQLLNAIKQFTYQVVPSLPTASADTMNVIYLVPTEDPKTKNVKDEFITIDNGAGAATRYTWEQIGSTQIDLSGYYTSAQTDAAITAALNSALANYTTTANLNTLLSGKVDKVSGKGLSTNDYTNEEKTKLGALPTNAELNTEFAISGVYDVSAKNPTAGPNNDGKFTLEYILNQSNVDTLIPSVIRKGGMSIKFVCSSDNKYVHYNLLSKSFTTDVTQWAIDDVGVYIESPEFVKLFVDSQDRILWGIKVDGDIYFGAGVPTQVKDYIQSKIAELGLNKVEDIITFLGDLVEGDTLATLLNGKVDKVTGKSLINAEYANGISYIESPEYVKLCVDNENKMLEGIRNDGKQFLPLPSNQDDILQEQIDAIKAQESQEDTNAIPIDSQNLINPNACVVGKQINANGQLYDAPTTYYSVSDYIPVNGRNILSNCTDNGAVSYGYAVYDENKGFIRVSTANNQIYNYQEGDIYIRLAFYGFKRYASYDTLPLTNIDYNEITGYLGKLDDSILPHKQELAIGNLNEYAVSRSVASYDVPSKEIDAYLGKDAYVGQDVVAVNHDDLNPTDYFGTRKIYNKYGFNADFNFILLPITQMSVFSEKIYNVRKLLKEGNTLGFHAYMNSSFWFMNKGFDIRPDSTFTYAPTFSDIRGTNPDGTGTNSFGYNVTSDTTFHDIGVFNGGVNENIKVVDATASDWLDTIIGFTVWGFRNNSTAINLDGNLVTKTMLGWAEYWYNELIDNTLGYSTEGTIAERFAADYEVPNGASANDYYPDAEHLNNGTVIFFDDTDNAHYSEAKAKTDINYSSATYQLVGRFKRGFFKGAASTCNYEVMSRVLQMATAFCQHYFGMQHFSHVNPHGNRYFTSTYSLNGFQWEDKNHQILSSANAYLYNTIEEKFKNYKDITYENGIKAATFGAVGIWDCFGMEGNFYGQEDFRGNSLNFIGQGGVAQILYLFEGLNGIYTYQEIYDKVMSFLPKNRYEWLSFIYNNANKVVTNADNESLRVSGGLKVCIDRILSCKGTGRIPALSLDTINNSVNTSIAFEMLCQFCNEHNLKLITTRAASILCSRHRPLQYNMMPNTAFNQMALELGNITPDGYRLSTGGCSVISETVDGNNYRVLKVYDSEKHSEVVTDIYGLTPGVYTFSCYIKTDDTTNEYDILRIEKCFNYQKINGTSVYVYDKAKDGVYREVTVDFEVPAPYHKLIDKSTPQNQICLGYENNFHHISVILSANAGKYVSMYNPKIIVKY